MTKNCNYDKKWQKNDKKLVFLKDKNLSLYHYNFKLITLKLFDENLQNKYYEPGFSYWGSDKKPPVAENFAYPPPSKNWEYSKNQKQHPNNFAWL